MRYLSYALSTIVGLLAATFVQGQKIPTLPVDPAVKSGTLPNGLTWYVATNPSVKGVADFALVQMVGAATDAGLGKDKVVEASQASLEAQPHLLSPSVQDYFTRLGVIPGVEGFVEVEDNATIFRFPNINILQSPSVVDSTLLVLMDIVGRPSREQDPLLKKWYTPADQAIIISGDVDHKQVVEKIRMLSYMVPKGTPVEREKYVWQEKDSMVVRVLPSRTEELSEIRATWRLQRTPREYMNTVQPVVFERFMTELGLIAEDRLRASFRRDSIPVADVSFVYDGGAETLGDERFSVSVSLRPEQLRDAVSAVSEVMASLNTEGATIKEIRQAEQRYLDMLAERDWQLEPKNRDYVSRCISAFIYNAPLTTQKQTRTFLQSKVLEDKVLVDLFRSVASTSTDCRRNLILEAATAEDTMTADSLEGLFSSAWMMAQEREVLADSIFRVPHLEGPSDKMKVKSVRKEYMSGGTIWTMANGMRVIFKKMPTSGVVHFSLALNGGYGNIPDLAQGEGLYVSDLLSYINIGGVDSKTFLNSIRQKGVRLDLDIDLSKTVISGEAADDRLEYLFRVLLTMMNDTKIDEERLEYYLECCPLRRLNAKGELNDRIAIIDSLMCPGYRYTYCHRYAPASEEFKNKVESFLGQQSLKVNDGVLILVGDLDEKKLKQTLQLYTGGFYTSSKAFSRPVMNYQPIAGGLSYHSKGRKNSVDIAVSMPLSLTTDNYYTSAVASLVLRRHLAQAVSGKGMNLRLNHSFERYPQERLGLLISMNEASIEGFAKGTAHQAPREALSRVHEILSDVPSMDISDALLSSFKARMKKRMSLQKSDPRFWIDALTFRYLAGKDLVTGAEAKIDAVSKDDIKELLESLFKSSQVEYIITR